jgi:hypothetical protein
MNIEIYKAFQPEDLAVKLSGPEIFKVIAIVYDTDLQKHVAYCEMKTL